MELKELEAALEGVLFAAGEPVGWSACVWGWRWIGPPWTQWPSG